MSPGGAVGRYVVGRAVQAVLTLLVALTLIWFAVTVLPGDPVRALFGFRQPTPEAYARVQEQLRLDEPGPRAVPAVPARHAPCSTSGDNLPRGIPSATRPGRPGDGAAARGAAHQRDHPRLSRSSCRPSRECRRGARGGAPRPSPRPLRRPGGAAARVHAGARAAYVSRVSSACSCGAAVSASPRVDRLRPAVLACALSTGYCAAAQGRAARRAAARRTRPRPARGWHVPGHAVHAMRPVAHPGRDLPRGNLGQLVTGSSSSRACSACRASAGCCSRDRDGTASCGRHRHLRARPVIVANAVPTWSSPRSTLRSARASGLLESSTTELVQRAGAER
jgi:hypothetical protein